jgi:hypothetical protein
MKKGFDDQAEAAEQVVKLPFVSIHASPRVQKSPLTKHRLLATQPNSATALEVGVPYGCRTRVAAVKEKRPIVIQRNFAAWIALYRT